MSDEKPPRIHWLQAFGAVGGIFGGMWAALNLARGTPEGGVTAFFAALPVLAALLGGTWCLLLVWRDNEMYGPRFRVHFPIAQLVQWRARAVHVPTGIAVFIEARAAYPHPMQFSIVGTIKSIMLAGDIQAGAQTDTPVNWRNRHVPSRHKWEGVDSFILPRQDVAYPCNLRVIWDVSYSAFYENVQVTIDEMTTVPVP